VLQGRLLSTKPEHNASLLNQTFASPVPLLKASVHWICWFRPYSELFLTVNQLSTESIAAAAKGVTEQQEAMAASGL